MPNAKKKDAEPVEAPREREAATRFCYHCGELLPESEFYKSNSELYYIAQCLPVCKSCLSDLYASYTMMYKSKKLAIKRLCMAFDIYYSDSAFKMCEEETSDRVVPSYIRKMNLMQNRKKSFENTLDEGFRFEGAAQRSLKAERRREEREEERGEQEQQDGEGQGGGKRSGPSQAMVAKWGAGFEAEDYQEMESHYKMLKKYNPDADSNQEIFIMSLCRINMLMMKALRENNLDGFTKANEQYSKTFTKAGLITVQETATGDDDCWGKWNEIVERYAPSEYYKDKKMFADFDHIGEYIERHLLRPLRNLMFGRADRDPQYQVVEKDGQPLDGYEPDEQELGEGPADGGEDGNG